MDWVKNIMKRILCNHEYKIETVFHGDMKNYGYGVERCKKCGKGRVVK